jgi:hypothetical protein
VARQGFSSLLQVRDRRTLAAGASWGIDVMGLGGCVALTANNGSAGEAMMTKAVLVICVSIWAAGLGALLQIFV